MGPDLGRVIIGGGYDVASCCALREGGRETKGKGNGRKEEEREKSEGERRRQIRMDSEERRRGGVR